MNLKTYYRAAVSDLRLRIADIAPSLAARGGMIYTLSADGVAHMMRPGRTEPVDWRDMDEIVRPIIEAADAYLREHDYYL